MDQEEWHRRMIDDLERWRQEIERSIWWLKVSRTLSEGAMLSFSLFAVSFFSEQEPRLWLWGVGIMLLLSTTGAYYYARRIVTRATRNGP